MLLNKDVEDLATDELDEVGVAAGLVTDGLDGVLREVDRTFSHLNRLENCLAALLVVELGKRDHAKHALGIGARIHEAREQGWQASQDEHEGDALLLDRLED